MVVEGSMPLDSPLYQMNPDRGAEYWNCRGVGALFTIEGDVNDLIPPGLKVSSNPGLGMVLFAEYGFSTLGPYNEFVSFIHVEDESGTSGLYVPYIYVTNDAAMAAGREILGAPKKIADISIGTDQDVVMASLSRPSNIKLAEIVMKPSERVPSGGLDALMPKDTPFYSRRYLPAPPGGTKVDELVKWSSEMSVHLDSFSDPIQFMGPGSLTYPAHSAIDPVHRLGVGTSLGVMYMEFDLHLRTGEVIKKYS